MTIINKNHYRTDVFQVVESLPVGFVVWNIGRHNFNHPGYIPLCKVVENYRVNLSNLKALYIGDENLCLQIMKEAGLHGVNITRLGEILQEHGATI